jgi:hypothetical protein
MIPFDCTLLKFLNMKNYIILLVFWCVSMLFAAAQTPTLPIGLAQSVTAEGLNPTAMVSDHHSNLFLAEKDGRVLLPNQDGVLQSDPVGSIPVNTFNKCGLADIHLHPDFDLKPWLSPYDSVPDSNKNHVSRLLVNESFVTSPARILGVAFHDINRNNIFDVDEQRLSAVFCLLNSAIDSSLVDLQISNGEGEYDFDSLSPGSYFIYFSAFFGSKYIPGQGISPNGLTPILPVGEGETMIVNAPFILKPGSLSGRLWLDANASGLPDPEEQGVSSAPLILFASDSTPVALYTTDNEGRFSMVNLSPGNYFIQVLTTVLPQVLLPSFGLNAQVQTLPFTVSSNENVVLDLGLKPVSLDAGVVKQEAGIWLYPNPVEQVLSVHWKPTDAPLTAVTITDMSGRQWLLQATPRHQTGTFDVEVQHLPPGMYLLRLELDTRVELLRFIKL